MDIDINKKVDYAHEEIADRIRERLRANGILALNIISSPGSGKTSLLERTLTRFREDYNIAVIEGDPETNRDALRLEKLRVPVYLINTAGTGASCHLSPDQVEEAIDKLTQDNSDIIFIENVGNLVCPAAYDLGEFAKILLFSVPEGSDQPAKYTLAFRNANIVLINKTDLLPYCDFDMAAFKKDALLVNPKLQIFEISIKTGDGLHEWFEWIEKHVQDLKK
ncbi:MAG: hydrogenase nickel incorporation protein HypB [Caldiserica bacterium]|nr:hydrogenase nickel incorporation protein HypB [Caldisericota bacterium]